MNNKIFILFISLLCIDHSLAEGLAPLPVTPSEKRFVEYLKETAQISFQDTLPIVPWVQCDDTLQKRTFFSASLYQFTNAQDINSKVQSWMASFLDYAYWGSVKTASCKYDINHFNECFASGSFRVTFRQKRIISLHEQERTQYCEATP